jgi:hypothetical protein
MKIMNKMLNKPRICPTNFEITTEQSQKTNAMLGVLKK